MLKRFLKECRENFCKSFLCKHNYLLVSILITIAFLVLTFTLYSTSFSHIWTSVQELRQALMGYLRFVFFLEMPYSPPITPPGGEIDSILPDAPGDLANTSNTFIRLLFSSANFSQFMGLMSGVLLIVLRFMPFIILIIFGLRRFIRQSFVKTNNKYNRDTLPLRAFKRASKVTFVPTKKYIVGLFEYLSYSRLPRIWLIIWLFNLNIFAIFISAVAVSFHFIVSLDIIALYYFVYRSVVLIVEIFHPLKLPLLVIFILWLIDKWRCAVALSKLRHMENMNKGNLADRSLCLFLVGTMGKGKTTLLTDMLLSVEAYFRFKAYEMLLEIDLSFSNFPWINFENELKREIKNGNVFNLASAGEWVKDWGKAFKIINEDVNLRENFLLKKFSLKPFEKFSSLGNEYLEIYSLTQRQRHYRKAIKSGAARAKALELCLPDEVSKCFDYDYKTYGLEYNDKKTITNLFSALSDYAKLYLIYIIQSSLLLTNYSVRTDNILLDKGNLPLWDCDFFTRDTRQIKHLSRHSHILDFDLLRLGKKVVKNNRFANAFEFGVIGITEIGKERGNQFKDSEIKETYKQLETTIKELEKAKKDVTREREELLHLKTKASQLNDKFNSALKLIRHKCTVRNFPFAKVIIDDQRPESLGADARDLTEVVHIEDSSKMKLAMPLYFIEELLLDIIFPKFKNTYQSYRFNRGDNTLLMYLLKKLGSGIYRYDLHIRNRFSYHSRQLKLESSATGDTLKEANYFLATQKIYSNRFATDAYNNIFANKLKSCRVGLNDILEYQTTKATVEEFKQQNSYLIEDLIKY